MSSNEETAILIRPSKPSRKVPAKLLAPSVKVKTETKAKGLQKPATNTKRRLNGNNVRITDLPDFA